MAVRPANNRTPVTAKKLRYSTKAWVAIISVLCGPTALVLLFTSSVPPSNRELFILVLGQVLGWGTVVVSSQFRPEGVGLEGPGR